MVETGQFPSWPRIEIRSPCISSSQTLSTVPALASERITALPTSSVWARSNSPRIVHARCFTAGMMVFQKSGGSFGGDVPLNDVEVVTSARQRYVDGTASHAILKLLASLKCRCCRKGRWSPPVRILKLTEARSITPYKGRIRARSGKGWCIRYQILGHRFPERYFS